MTDVAGDPLKRPDTAKRLLGAVYDTMGADFLRKGLEERNVPEEEIEEIMREFASEREGGA
jgi:hypothetical protein